MKKLSSIYYIIGALLIFTIFNPTSGGDLFAFVAIAVIILYKLLGNYALLALLITRPALDYWRDYSLFSYNTIQINMNAAVSTLLLVWSIIFFAENYKYFKEIPSKNLWITFLLWSGLTFLWSFDKSTTVIETFKVANLFALFGMTYILRTKNELYFDKIFFWSLVCSAIIPIALGFYQFTTNTGLIIDGTPNRIYGTFAHPNILATFALLLFIFLFHKYQNYLAHPTKILKFLPNWLKESKNDLYIISLTIFAIIIALTYTRIAWIGLAFFLIMVGLFYKPKNTVAIAGVLSAMYLLFFPINDWLTLNFNVNLQQNPLVARLTSRNMEADSISWRADLYNKILPLWKKRPLIGYGNGAFARVWDDNKGVDNIWDSTSEAHNDYLKIGFENGIIGLALYLSIFASLIYKAIKFGQKNNWKNYIFISSLFIYLLLSVSDNMLHHTPVIWWLWSIWGYWSAKV